MKNIKKKDKITSITERGDTMKNTKKKTVKQNPESIEAIARTLSKRYNFTLSCHCKINAQGKTKVSEASRKEAYEVLKDIITKNNLTKDNIISFCEGYKGKTDKHSKLPLSQARVLPSLICDTLKLRTSSVKQTLKSLAIDDNILYNLKLGYDANVLKILNLSQFTCPSKKVNFDDKMNKGIEILKQENTNK